MAEAKPYREIQAETRSEEAAEAERQARELLECSSILDKFGELCQRLGLVGEQRHAKLLYLAVTSRLLEKLVSVLVKGPSSAGKSYLVATILRTFPPTAYFDITSLSEHALIYWEEPLTHRFLVIYEWAGLSLGLGSYLICSLLSEGCLRYATVEKTPEGLRARFIEREGPTGLIATTTCGDLHPENETRALSIRVRDDQEQTAAILGELAKATNGGDPRTIDLEPWHALQTWLELAGCHQVAIPFAPELAKRTSSKAVGLRRDFSVVLSLIAAHAILHQKQRERDGHGRIVPTLEDYGVVYDLVLPSLGEGIQASVSSSVREVVLAVDRLHAASAGPVSIAELARELGLGVSAVRYRVRAARRLGCLANLETRRNQPLKLVPGETLPEEEAVLPSPDDLKECGIIPPVLPSRLPDQVDAVPASMAPSKASIPRFMTASMRRDLFAKGFSVEEVAELTPVEAGERRGER